MSAANLYADGQFAISIAKSAQLSFWHVKVTPVGDPVTFDFLQSEDFTVPRTHKPPMSRWECLVHRCSA